MSTCSRTLTRRARACEETPPPAPSPQREGGSRPFPPLPPRGRGGEGFLSPAPQRRVIGNLGCPAGCNDSEGQHSSAGEETLMLREIIIVSGLPRSGTSLMMQMLDNGGVEVVTDHVRTADPDNPKGYYEFEPVKKLKRDQSWLPAT